LTIVSVGPSPEAIAAFVEAESWQLDEIQKGLTELDILP
jgi:predicted transcriptional regulator